jgi:hypothetical protein
MVGGIDAYLLGSAARAEVANGRERETAAVSCAMCCGPTP